MRFEAFRQEMDSFRDRVDREALELKDSYLALDRLASLYERFDESERAMADRVLAGWVLSEDEGLRFDAIALVRKFRVVDAVPALRELSGRLVDAAHPGAPFEREKVEGLIAELTDGADLRGP